MIDNPPMKNKNGTMLTEFMLIGDFQLSQDPNFLKSNYISHIVNTCPDKILNIYDKDTTDVHVRKLLSDTD